MNYSPLVLLSLSCCLSCGSERTQTVRQAEEARAITGDLHERHLEIESAESVGFGLSVAAVENDVLVGAPSLALSDAGVGAVIPFDVDSGIQAEPLAPPPTNGQLFGSALAAKSGRVAVGGPYPSEGPGNVWVFDRTTSGWLPTATDVLSPPESDTHDSGFGMAVSLTDELLVVGSGIAAYVFEANGAHWHEPVTLVPESGIAEGSSFGWAVAAQGETAVVGAPYAGASGIVYIFEQKSGWEEPLAIDGELAGALVGASFGDAVALSGSRLFVAAPFDREETGVVYSWTRASDGTWAAGPSFVSKQGATPDGVAGEGFGRSLAVSLGLLFVGSPLADEFRGRIQAFSLEPPNVEVVRISRDTDANVMYFGTGMSATESTLVVAAADQAFVYSLKTGAACEADEHCRTGHCVEGVCCDSACDGGCSSCLAAAKGAGPNGACGPVRAGTNPHKYCQVSAKICGTTGSCDGRGACAVAATSVECGAAQCPSTTASQARMYCDGDGDCPPAKVTSCAAGYACVSGACSTSCSQQLDCTDGYYCFDGSCVEGGRCSDDRLTAFDERGSSVVCETVKCIGGECPERCEVSDDCITGLCHPETHRCVTAESAAPSDSDSRSANVSCTCSALTASPHNLPGSFVFGSALVLLVTRRSRSRRVTS